MSVPHLLLLTGTPPGYPGVGGIFLHDLCISYAKGSLSCFTVAPPHCRSVATDLDWLPMVYAPIPSPYEFKALGSWSTRLSRFLSWRYINMIKIPALVEGIVQFGRRQRIEMVWAVLNGPLLFGIAGKVASELEVGLATTIWDPPEYLIMNGGFDRFLRRALLGDFEKALSMSVKCGVASEGMAEEYEEKYGVDPVVLIHGVHPGLRRPPTTGLTTERQFIIGFVGSLYAWREWQALLSALSKVNWQIEGRDIVIRVLGSGASFYSQGKAHIEYLGWRPFEETIDLMSQVDVAYLPYWFDESHKLSVRLCFPNKLTAYLAAGKPVLFHGPKDSSPARFFRRFPVGLCCHSLEEAEIVESLRRFVTDREFYAAAGQAAQMAIDQELDLRIFRRRFATLIGIQEDELVPLAQ